MATVTGLTAQRMAEIEGQSIVDGEVVGNNLVLTKHNGQTVDAGVVRGAPGEGVAIKKVLLPKIKLLTNGPGTVLATGISTSGYHGAVAWSPDQRFLAIGNASSPYISVYAFNGDKLSKAPNPAVLPTSSVVSCAWSPDGRYLAVGFLSSPYFSVYRFNGTSLVKLSNPTTMPSSNVLSVSWSPYGSHIMVGTDSSPYLYAYAFENEVLAPMTVSTTPTSRVNAISWSPEGDFFCVGVTSTPYIVSYSFDGLSFTKLNQPSVIPDKSVTSLSFSPDGTCLAVTSYDIVNTVASSEPLVTYSYDSKSLTKQTSFSDSTLASFPGVNEISWSPDSSMLVLAHGHDYLRSYILDGSQITNVHSRAYSGVTGGLKNGVAWSPDGQFVASTGASGFCVQRTFAKYFADGTYTYAYR